MEAVKIVAQALNEIFDKTPLIMKRQIKTGQNAGVRVEGKIDLRQLPSPKIVMINCSFDSVCARARDRGRAFGGGTWCGGGRGRVCRNG